MFRVIETFSGIGSQAKALTRIGKPFEIVNTADWDINAILAYCLIHKGKIDINKYADISDEDMGKYAYKQRVVDYNVNSIDKRQYMRFGGEEAQDLITFESTDDVIAISDISRGGVSLKHNKKLKVGDVVPVHLTYGDLEINANVKIVSASDVKAGGQFIDLDQATANKLLYLSLLEKDQPIAQTIQNSNITTTIEE